MEICNRHNVCKAMLMVEHDLQCRKGRIILAHHKDMLDEWGALCAASLTPKYISHKPLIFYGGKLSVRKGSEPGETRVDIEWEK